jgi:hypothetical protein
MNENQTPITPEPKKKESGVGLASVICGGVAFLFNPLYLVSLAAVILGIIGIAKANSRPKTMAIVGLCLGGALIVLGIVWDVLITIFSAGIGIFSFCF